jgi:exopolysaccharide biosynthesis polyprenyl glycosylphosphotransferase
MVVRSSTSHRETRTETTGRRGARAAPLAALVVPAVDVATLVAAVALFRRAIGLGVLYGVSAFLVLAATGTRRARINPTLGHDIPTVLGRLAVAFLLVAGPALLLGTASAASLAELARVAAWAILLVPVGRGVAYAAVRSARARGHLLQRALIVGAGEAGNQLARILQEHREYGLVPVGFVDSLGGSGLAMPLLGDTSTLVRTVERDQVTTVIIASGAMSDQELVDVLRVCDTLPVEVYVIPRFVELGVTPDSPSIEDVWGIPLIWLRRPARKRTARLTKRAFDLVAASVGLLLSAPVFLAAALAVQCSSPGPVFFRQLRIGKDGRPFELLKFRTMQVNSDSDTTWSVVGDARVTRVGALLRRTYLDELPQLVNVLRGEMSLIGPRPERPHFASRFAREVPRYHDRHRAPGGITGWAQVHGLRGDTPIPDRARFDNHYIEHWSLWRDVVIVARTFANMLLGR